MSKIEDGGPAFPRSIGNNGLGHPDHESNRGHEGMTLRQYAAIKLCVPESGEPWLDDMIRKAQRDRFAGQALMGLRVYGPKHAYEAADAMLEARAPATYKQEFDG